MKYYFITFRSVTHGQRAEKLLQNEGIRCVLARTPKWMEARGCGYSLRIRTEHIAGITALLRQKNIPMQKVYFQNGEEEMEELRL